LEGVDGIDEPLEDPPIVAPLAAIGDFDAPEADEAASSTESTLFGADSDGSDFLTSSMKVIGATATRPTSRASRTR
jgi:hypothetical protein